MTPVVVAMTGSVAVDVLLDVGGVIPVQGVSAVVFSAGCPIFNQSRL